MRKVPEATIRALRLSLFNFLQAETLDDVVRQAVRCAELDRAYEYRTTQGYLMIDLREGLKIKLEWTEEV